MDKIRGVNLGNWLVLEKWMNPELFSGTIAEDETDLCEMLPHDELVARLKSHRDTYITLNDFRTIENWGLNVVRLPVPYFIFDDYAPFIGCIDYLDKAFEWAQITKLKILIDLHTVPDSQNGFDNGGLSGVCKFHQKPENVDFAVNVLARLAIRYKNNPALYGIEFLNEPISPELFDALKSANRYPPRDPKRAEGSSAISVEFLYDFYNRCYNTLRCHLDENVALVFHDGFRMKAWKDLFRGSEYKNVVMDTHLYLSFMTDTPGSSALDAGKGTFMKQYMDLALDKCSNDIKEMQQFFPVIVGEWSVAYQPGQMGITPRMERSAIAAMANAQLYVWEQADGWLFWSYKLLNQMPGWDFRDMVGNGFFFNHFN